MSLTAIIVLLIWVLVLVGLVFLALWLIDMLAGAAGLPANIATIFKVVVIAIAVLIVISWLVGFLPGPPHLFLKE